MRKHLHMDRTNVPNINPRITEKIQQYKQQLVNAGIPVEKLIVFGSQIRGTARADSDIDLCVLSSQFPENDFDLQVQLLLLRTRDTIEIEPHPMRPSDFLDQYNALASEIQKYGIVVG